MKKIRTTLWIILLSFGLFFVFTSSAKAEIIHEFYSTINVLPDSSLLVKEKIIYDFEEDISRGIVRTIPLINSEGKPLEVKVISILNELDEPYKFKTETSGQNLNVKIGDPEMMISGLKEYYISYHVYGVVNYLNDFDEISWNVNGNDWQVPIEKIEAKIILPNNISPQKQDCYIGTVGNKCDIIGSSFTSKTELKEAEGLTIITDFHKGIVSIYKHKTDPIFVKYIKMFWPIVIPIVVFLYIFTLWLKKGREIDSVSMTIIPRYDVPDSLTPLEVGAIMNEKFKNKNISAEIIYLAQKGFLEIKQIDPDCDNYLCLNIKKDYELTLLKEEGLLPNTFDKKIISSIFGADSMAGGKVKLSELNNIFYKSIPEIDDLVIKTLLKKKYFKSFHKIKPEYSISFALLILGLLLAVQNFRYVGNIIIFLSSAIVSVVILFIFHHMMSVRTTKGVETKKYLLGLREYLQIFEKDKLHFPDAPVEDQELFEKLLPYAMTFNVEESWIQEFKDKNISLPKWYESKKSFDNFAEDMLLFNTITNFSFSSTSSIPSMNGEFLGGKIKKLWTRLRNFDF